MKKVDSVIYILGYSDASCSSRCQRLRSALWLTRLLMKLCCGSAHWIDIPGTTVAYFNYCTFWWTTDSRSWFARRFTQKFKRPREADLTDLFAVPRLFDFECTLAQLLHLDLLSIRNNRALKNSETLTNVVAFLSHVYACQMYRAFSFDISHYLRSVSYTHLTLPTKA